jgi:isoleucyl-tRNA synthetase
VVLSTELTDELIAEGYARELVRAIQDHRKEIGCEYTDRIAVGIATDSPELRAAAEQFENYIRGETLASRFGFEAVAGAEPAELDVAGFAATLYVEVDKQHRSGRKKEH